ncbi:hypothetical protein HWV62_44554 [Athelia sp. TMB]|nr:hypothetical protein HWV62_44554 [Athelia sp. TMB]
MASTVAEPISAAEPISNNEDVLKQTTNATPSFLDVSDASLTQKDEVDAQETGSEDAASAVASEDITRASLESLADKSQLPRPYEPIAKTLEGDKENIPHPESPHIDISGPTTSEIAFEDSPLPFEQTHTIATGVDASAIVHDAVHEAASEAVSAAHEDLSSPSLHEHVDLAAENTPSVEEVEAHQTPSVELTAELEEPKTSTINAEGLIYSSEAEHPSAPVDSATNETALDSSHGSLAQETAVHQPEAPDVEAAGLVPADASPKRCYSPSCGEDGSCYSPSCPGKANGSEASHQAKVGSLTSSEPPAEETSVHELKAPLEADSLAPSDISPKRCYSPSCGEDGSCYSPSCPGKTSDLPTTFEEHVGAPASSADHSIRDPVQEATPIEVSSESVQADEKVVEPTQESTPAPESVQHEAPSVEAEADKSAPAQESVSDEEDEVLASVQPHDDASGNAEIELEETAPKEHQDVVAGEDVVGEANVDSEAPLVQGEVEQSADQLSIKTSDEIERPKSPWTPSYSVTTQGPSDTSEASEEVEEAEPSLVAPEAFVDHVGPTQTADSTVAATTVEDVPADAPESIHAQDPIAKSPSVLALDTSSLHSREEEFKDERPKSPWTPSYSVISQGTVDKNAALDQLDQLPPSVVSASPDAVLALESAPDSSNSGSNEAKEISRSLRRIPSINITSSEESEDNPAVAQDTAAAAASDEVPLPQSPQISVQTSVPTVQSDEERPRSPWSPSYSVTNQGPISQDAEIEQLEQLPPPAPHSDEEPPKSPWTPSYSVTSQGPVSQDSEIEQLEQLPPPVQQSDEEPPKSPWTPSYSVTSQGPVYQDSEIEQLEQLPPPVQPSAEEPPKSPWTPSYSVTNQGPVVEDLEIEQLAQLPPPVTGAATHEEGAVAQPEISNAQVSRVPSIDVTKSFDVQETNSLHNISAAEEAVVTKSPSQLSINLPATITTSEEERPKSPWTPSYSVTRQGSVTKDPAELDDSEQLPPPKSPWTPSYSVTRQGSVSQDAGLDQLEQLPPNSVEAPLLDSSARSASPSPAVVYEPPSSIVPAAASTEEADAPANIALIMPEVDVPDRPASPWTPSYSVTTQGPDEGGAGEKTTAESAEVQDLLKGQPFPANQPETQVAEKKPSQLQVNTSDSTHGPEEPVAAGSRKRTESAISRFFPGGWFSSSPTVPDVNRTRTSTEVATGEFIRSASQDGAQPESATTPVAAPGEEETKPRWCTIM